MALLYPSYNSEEKFSHYILIISELSSLGELFRIRIPLFVLQKVRCFFFPQQPKDSNIAINNNNSTNKNIIKRSEIETYSAELKLNFCNLESVPITKHHEMSHSWLILT